MITTRILRLTGIALAIALMGCKEDATTVVPPGPPNTGTANFTRYVSIGNSLTAGFQSNALSQRDQVYSYPNLLAGQAQVSFVQPLIVNPGIGGRIRLVTLSPPTLVTEASVIPLPSANLNITHPQPFNNLGI